MCDKSCVVMEFFGHFAKNEALSEKVSLIISAIEKDNTECKSCPYKELTLLSNCNYETCTITSTFLEMSLEEMVNHVFSVCFDYNLSGDTLEKLLSDIDIEA